MKLKFYKSDPPNFGDELNSIMWEYIFPEDFFNDSENGDVFLGIGTLINSNFITDSEKSYWVLGSGAGYGPPPGKEIRLHVYALRGPLTAKRLNQPEHLAATDAAALLSKLPVQPLSKIYDFSYMPHFTEHVYNGETWKWCCERAGVHYISPCDPPHRVMDQIRQSRVLLSEAMHGAIVADVFRVPWIAVSSKKEIDNFKWEDWCGSLELSYCPYRIKRLGSIMSRTTPLRYLICLGVSLQIFWARRLAQPCLSDDSIFQQKLRRLEKAVDDLIASRFKKRRHSNHLNPEP